MPSTIGSETISAVPDKRIILTNSNFARPFLIAGGWTKIRISMRLAITDSGANITSSPRFAIGLCSGETNIFQDATTTHWCGFINNSATWTRDAGPPIGYNIGGALPWAVSKRIGSTTTMNASTITGISNTVLYEKSTANRTAMFVTITKGSPNYTFSIFSRNTPAASDVTLATFLAQVDLAIPAMTNHGSDNGTFNTIAIDEGANGTFDHVNIAWDRSGPQIHVSDLGISKLA